MDRFEPNLRIPGPTALPPSVRTAGGRQMINHRGPEFAAMLAPDPRGHEAVLRDDSDVAMITTAGSGGLEAAIVEHALAGRSRARREHRLVRRSVREDRRGSTAPT